MTPTTATANLLRHHIVGLLFLTGAVVVLALGIPLNAARQSGALIEVSYIDIPPGRAPSNVQGIVLLTTTKPDSEICDRSFMISVPKGQEQIGPFRGAGVIRDLPEIPHPRRPKIQRLTVEWKTGRRLVLAIDRDDTSEPDIVKAIEIEEFILTAKLTHRALRYTLTTQFDR